MASDIAGLELQHKASKKWISSDAVAKPWEIICIIGEKIPAFTRCELFPGTLHRVVRLRFFYYLLLYQIIKLLNDITDIAGRAVLDGVPA